MEIRVMERSKMIQDQQHVEKTFAEAYREQCLYGRSKTKL